MSANQFAMTKGAHITESNDQQGKLDISHHPMKQKIGDLSFLTFLDKTKAVTIIAFLNSWMCTQWIICT